MIRMNFFLLVAVLASAMYLVSIQYESRNLYSALDEAQREIVRLEADRDRLQVERRTRATPARVERLARENLQMRFTSPGITTYVTYSTPPVSTASSSNSSSSTGAKKP